MTHHARLLVTHAPSLGPKLTLPEPIPALRPWELVPLVLGMRWGGQTGVNWCNHMDAAGLGLVRLSLACDQGWEGGGAGMSDGFALAAAVLQPLSAVKLPGKI